MIEILVTMVVIGVVASIAIPRLRGAVVRARAAVILSDARVAELAALDYFVDHDAWPPAAPPGEVPEELRPFLPDGFTFARGSVSFAYGPLAAVPQESGDSLGLSVHISNDPTLLAALKHRVEGDGQGAEGRWGSSSVLIVDEQAPAPKRKR